MAPFALNVTLGSLKASYPMPVHDKNRVPGTTSPKRFPPSSEYSRPVWLNPLRESFCPITRLCGSVGFTATISSACRRREQSWFTRTLPGRPFARNTCPHPVGPGTVTTAGVAAPDRSSAAVAMTPPLTCGTNVPFGRRCGGRNPARIAGFA